MSGALLNHAPAIVLGQNSLENENFVVKLDYSLPEIGKLFH